MGGYPAVRRFLLTTETLKVPTFYPDDACGINPLVPQPNSKSRHKIPCDSLETRLRHHTNQLNVEAMRAWWLSRGQGRPYREWKYEDDEPMPPPRKRAVSPAPAWSQSLSTGNPVPPVAEHPRHLALSITWQHWL